MAQQAADIVQSHRAQPSVTFRIKKEGYAVLYQHLVEMHPIARLAEKRLGHIGHRLIVGSSRHFGHVFHLHGGIGAFQ